MGEFIAENWITLLSIIGAITSLVLAIFNAKSHGNSKGIVALFEQIPALVSTAECLYGSGKGVAKLDYVLTQLKLFALQNKIKVETGLLESQVNSVVQTTNVVNKGKQPQEIDFENQKPSDVEHCAGGDNVDTPSILPFENV